VSERDSATVADPVWERGSTSRHSNRENDDVVRSRISTIAALLLALLSALPVLAAEPSEHWRCGPYDIRIVPGNSYVPGENITLDDDTGFLVRRNGRDAGRWVIRARMHEIEKDGCQYHSCPNGARTAWWGGTTDRNKHDANGELLTIDGVTRYTESIYGGKTGRLLKSEEHLCRRVPW
jgi:hypothetical protein